MEQDRATAKVLEVELFFCGLRMHPLGRLRAVMPRCKRLRDFLVASGRAPP
jgi:hypothetical protein